MFCLDSVALRCGILGVVGAEAGWPLRLVSCRCNMEFKGFDSLSRSNCLLELLCPLARPFPRSSLRLGLAVNDRGDL